MNVEFDFISVAYDRLYATKSVVTDGTELQSFVFSVSFVNKQQNCAL